MKKILLPIAFVISAHAFAQNVAINSTGAAAVTSAALDVDMANKGILIPRVALTTTSAFAPVTGTATESLLVYNTATSGAGITAVTPGYYYWDGAQWVKLIGGADSYWRVGTSAADVNQNAGTRFLGTTTNQHMDYVTNGIVRGRFSNLGEFFVGTTATALPGDLMNGVGNATFSWAVNGYTTFNSGAVYGLRQAGATGAWGSVQGETDPTIPAGNSGVSGLAGSNAHRGVTGQKPAGGAGFGGLFLNDLGYSGGVFNLSDERLKTNINRFNSGLDIIGNINIYTYYMDTVNYNILGGSELHYGVMAQELKEIVPSIVQTKNVTPISSRQGPDYKGPDFEVNMVNYMELVPIAIQAIKEQQILIKEQQTTIQTLEERLKALEKKFEELNK